MTDGATRPGTLYLCATPIGNLEDMTYRAVRVLGEVPLIAAEDTRHTRELLTHFDLHTRLTSYHEHNKYEKGPELIAWLKEGSDLALVSDAGLPGICDPGSHLAHLAIEADISVSPLPGANAGLSALICSGLDTTRFSFIGFLPRTSKKQRELLDEIKTRRDTLIFYEAPHHLRATLKALAETLGGAREAALGRELTKKFEEFQRGTLDALIRRYEEKAPRGEYVIVVSGADESEQSPVADEPQDVFTLYKKNLARGMANKEAMRETAKTLGIGRREVYQRVLENE